MSKTKPRRPASGRHVKPAHHTKSHRKARRAAPSRPARKATRKAHHVDAEITATSATNDNAPPTWPERSAYAQVVIHAPGKTDGRGMCGADVPGIPAGDPALWGPLHERHETTIVVLGELALATAIAAELFPGAVSACVGCKGNLERMRDGDARKLEGFRGRTAAERAGRAA